MPVPRLHRYCGFISHAKVIARDSGFPCPSLLHVRRLVLDSLAGAVLDQQRWVIFFLVTDARWFHAEPWRFPGSCRSICLRDVFSDPGGFRPSSFARERTVALTQTKRLGSANLNNFSRLNPHAPQARCLRFRAGVHPRLPSKTRYQMSAKTFLRGHLSPQGSYGWFPRFSTYRLPHPQAFPGAIVHFCLHAPSPRHR